MECEELKKWGERKRKEEEKKNGNESVCVRLQELRQLSGFKKEGGEKSAGATTHSSLTSYLAVSPRDFAQEYCSNI